jgi:hypothetical protein
LAVPFSSSSSAYTKKGMGKSGEFSGSTHSYESRSNLKADSAKLQVLVKPDTFLKIKVLKLALVLRNFGDQVC